MHHLEGTDHALSDARLVARIAEGDARALAELYRRYAARIRASLRRIAGDAEADDLVNEVFLTVWLRASSYDATRARVAAWIMWLARNKAIDVARRAKRQAAAAASMDVDVAGPASARTVVDATRIYARVAALPSDQRATLEQAFGEGLSYSEIATRERIALGTVKSRAARAMRAIRSTIAAPNELPAATM